MSRYWVFANNDKNQLRVLEYLVFANAQIQP